MELKVVLKCLTKFIEEVIKVKRKKGALCSL